MQLSFSRHNSQCDQFQIYTGDLILTFILNKVLALVIPDNRQRLVQKLNWPTFSKCSNTMGPCTCITRQLLPFRPSSVSLLTFLAGLGVLFWWSIIWSAHCQIIVIHKRGRPTNSPAYRHVDLELKCKWWCVNDEGIQKRANTFILVWYCVLEK